MNKSLIKKLTDKWDKPDGLPAKGHELVTGGKGLSPCAQSEAIMLSKGLGVTDFEAFWKGGLRGIWGPALNLDETTAQTLGISVIHSILLRRFNDLSSRSPSVVLTDPEKVLGKNWKKVLDFWAFVDRLEQDEWGNLIEVASGTDNLDDFREKRTTLRDSTDKLDVIYPDLHYLPGVSKVPLEGTSLTKKTVDEALEMYPDLEKSFSALQQTPRYLQNKGASGSVDGVLVVGGYSRAYFGWIATFDYFLTNFQTVSTPLRTASYISKLQLLFSCATNEIQVLEKGQTFKDLYFCKLIGFDPFRSYFLEKSLQKIKDTRLSASRFLQRWGKILSNLVFNKFSPSPEVKTKATKEMVEGVLKLSEEDISTGVAYGKVQETYEIGKGRFFGTLTVKIPKLGPNPELNTAFQILVLRLKENYNVWPISFCEKGGPSEEGSEWAVGSKVERINPRFNAPTRPLNMW